METKRIPAVVLDEHGKPKKVLIDVEPHEEEHLVLVTRGADTSAEDSPERAGFMADYFRLTHVKHYGKGRMLTDEERAELNRRRPLRGEEPERVAVEEHVPWVRPEPEEPPQRSLFDSLADFDGATYVRALDHERLGAQLLRIGKLMADGQWHTLAELSQASSDPEASVSARLRDLRKAKFGGHVVERERLSAGLFKYRLVREENARPWEDS